MNVDDQLYTDWLADVDGSPEGEPESIDIGDEAAALERADWHLRHVARIDREHGVLATVFQAELRRIKERWDAEVERLGRQREWHLAPLTALHAALLEREPHRRSIRLPHGTLKARTETKPSIEWVDRDAFIEWAEDNADDLLRYKVEPDVNECKRILAAVDDKFVTPAGEVVPGIVPVPPTTKFSVSVQ